MLLAYLRDAVNSTHDGAPDNFCSTRFPDVTALTAAAGAQYVRPLPFELGTCNWASVQALPRIVTTAAGGARVQLRPLPEMASLRIGPSVRLGPTTLTPSSAQPLAVNISNGRQFELLVRFRAAPVRGAKCGVQLLGSLEKGPDGSAREFTEVGVGYDLDGGGSARTIGPSRVQGYVHGARHSMLKAVPGPTALAPIFAAADGDGSTTLHLFVDHSIVEAFFQNDTAAAVRSYPMLPAADAVWIVARGGDCELVSLEVWQLQSTA